jgi:hypothetical protein
MRARTCHSSEPRKLEPGEPAAGVCWQRMSEVSYRGRPYLHASQMFDIAETEEPHIGEGEGSLAIADCIFKINTARTCHVPVSERVSGGPGRWVVRLGCITSSSCSFKQFPTGPDAPPRRNPLPLVRLVEVVSEHPLV